jgi:hypothetical protein
MVGGENFSWNAIPVNGNSATEHTLPTSPLYEVEDPPLAMPASGSGEMHFQLMTALENAIQPDTSLHALIQQAGVGDELWLAQLHEHKY